MSKEDEYRRRDQIAAAEDEYIRNQEQRKKATSYTPKPRYEKSKKVKTTYHNSDSGEEADYRVGAGYMTFLIVGIYLIYFVEMQDLITVGLISAASGVIIRYTLDFIISVVRFLFGILVILVLIYFIYQFFQK